MRVHFRGNLFTEPLPSNKLFRLSGVMSQYSPYYERFEIVMAVAVNVAVLWDVMSCSLVDINVYEEPTAAMSYREDGDGVAHYAASQPTSPHTRCSDAATSALYPYHVVS
jgi:hypothetical protein